MKSETSIAMRAVRLMLWFLVILALVGCASRPINAPIALMWIPVTRDWRLNERHYGALQGLNKAEKDFDPKERFTEKDMVLITYGDMVEGEGDSPLGSLHKFVATMNRGAVNTLHFLLFFGIPQIVDFPLSTTPAWIRNWERGEIFTRSVWNKISCLTACFSMCATGLTRRGEGLHELYLSFDRVFCRLPWLRRFAEISAHHQNRSNSNGLHNPTINI